MALAPTMHLPPLFARAQAFTQGGTALLAVSGGSDSVALAGTRRSRSNGEQTRKLTIVHVNHQVRASSTQDEAVVVALGAHLHFASAGYTARTAGFRRSASPNSAL